MTRRAAAMALLLVAPAAALAHSEGRMKGPAGSLVFVEENHDLPLVRAQVTLRTGAAADPAELDGLANFAAELMARGAGGRTRAQLDAAFDALGTSLEVLTDHDGVSFEVTTLRSRLDAALALLGTVLVRPDFPALEAEKLKREIQGQLDELRDDDAQVGRRLFQRALFGSHPYGRTIIGSERSLSQIALEDARRWHAGAVRGGMLLFGLAGDVTPDDASAAIHRHFAALPEGGTPPSPPPEPPARTGVRITLVDKPERTQSQIFIGQPAPRWADPDFLPLKVTTTAFGGTFTARLMEEVRSKRGLSYGASAQLAQGRGAKALVVHVFPSLEQTPETLELVLGMYRVWAEAGLTEAEIEFAKGYLASSFAFHLATPEDRLDLRVAIELAGLPEDHVRSFVERVRAVTPDEVRRVMRAHLRPEALEVCVVGTAAELQPLLDRAGLTKNRSVEVLAYDEY